MADEAIDDPAAFARVMMDCRHPRVGHLEYRLAQLAPDVEADVVHHCAQAISQSRVVEATARNVRGAAELLSRVAPDWGLTQEDIGVQIARAAAAADADPLDPDASTIVNAVRHMRSEGEGEGEGEGEARTLDTRALAERVVRVSSRHLPPP